MESRAKVLLKNNLGIHINVWICCKSWNAFILTQTKKNTKICKSSTWLFKSPHKLDVIEE